MTKPKKIRVEGYLNVGDVPPKRDVDAVVRSLESAMSEVVWRLERVEKRVAQLEKRRNPPPPPTVYSPV